MVLSCLRLHEEYQYFSVTLIFVSSLYSLWDNHIKRFKRSHLFVEQKLDKFRAFFSIVTTGEKITVGSMLPAVVIGKFREFPCCLGPLNNFHGEFDTLGLT